MRDRMLSGKGLVPLLFSSLLIILCLAGCAQDSSILDNSQNRQLGFSVSTHGWNSSNSNSSDCEKDSRATPISGTTFDTSKSFNVIADVNKGGSWSTEVNNETAFYSNTNSIWQTSFIHYWPGAASTVDFYAYYPTSISGSITHTAGSAPVLSYTVHDNTADQIDILASSKTGVAGDSYNQTPVDFKHIFAAVQFKSGTAGLPDGTGAVLKIKSIQYKGTYTFGSGWTIFPDVKDLSQTVNLSTFGTSADITNDGETFMMLPQTFSNVTIEITYTNGLVLSKTINGTWEAGKTYIYNLTKSITYNYDYTGNVQTFTAPYTGTYKIECWGAAGGSATYNTTAEGGKGGYSYGNLALTKDKILYISVGGAGANGTTMNTTLGGWNGGASRVGTNVDHIVGGGGGCTSIQSSLIGDGQLKNYESVKDADVLIVAGGGGGGFWRNASGFVFSGIGGTGGGTNGGNGTSGWAETPQPWGSGGTQTSGGTNSYNEPGSFGMGGGDQNLHAGGGGGLYGGGAGYGGAGGGSGYIGGVSDGTMQNGVRSGDGYARITFVSAN